MLFSRSGERSPGVLYGGSPRGEKGRGGVCGRVLRERRGGGWF